MKTNTIITGNSIEIMKQFPDKSIDLTLTDFPYGVNVEYDIFKDTQENLKELISKAMPEILRVSKVALITTGTKNIFLYPKPDWILNWTNKAGIGLSKWGFACWQPILAYGKDPYLENRKGSRPDTIVSSDITNVKKYSEFHPCPKPEKVWEWLLLRGSIDNNNIILDPFCGSGTTGVVAKKYGRRYICIDISKRYCDIAKKRIEKQLKIQKQKSLFDMD